MMLFLRHYIFNYMAAFYINSEYSDKKLHTKEDYIAVKILLGRKLYANVQEEPGSVIFIKTPL